MTASKARMRRTKGQEKGTCALGNYVRELSQFPLFVDKDIQTPSKVNPFFKSQLLAFFHEVPFKYLKSIVYASNYWRFSPTLL